MAKLVVFGSARMDAFMGVPEDKANQYCSLDTNRCVVELSYSAKIPLNTVDFRVGGNGANVALGSQRMGVESMLVAEIGTGPLADQVKLELGREIDVNKVTQTNGVDQGFGAVIGYQGERTILSYYSPLQPPFPENLTDPDWAYLTSTGQNFSDYYEEIYEWVKKSGVKLAFNPGGRQIAKGKEWLKKYLAVTELIFVNREEAEGITGFTKSFGKERELLDRLCDFGPKIPVVTDGRSGAFAKGDGKYYKIGILPVDAIERTGAGDAFSVGCMSAIIRGKGLQRGLVKGTINSTSVIGYVGPEEGLLKNDQVSEWEERMKSNNVRVEEF